MTIEKLAAALKGARGRPEDAEGVTIVEDGEWTQEHKYQTCFTVVEFCGELFGILRSRSGSYHSDWHYSDVDVYPVEEKEQTKVVVAYPVTGEPVSVPVGY